MSLPKYNPAHATAYAIGVMRGIRDLRIVRMSIPADAATARTAESEEDPTPKLFIPPAARVAHLIRDATMWEDAARSDEKAGNEVDIERREARLNRATRLRVKAIAIHLGIEKE